MKQDPKLWVNIVSRFALIASVCGYVHGWGIDEVIRLLFALIIAVRFKGN